MRLALLFVSCVLGACASQPAVTIDGEQLVGQKSSRASVAEFLGIPYAEPPVGSLRWAAPQPPVKKHTQRKVQVFAPACPQQMYILDWYRDYAERFGAPRSSYPPLETSEDCLYLNVWTPSLSGNVPVMVYVHGGSNAAGWSYEQPYHGARLAERGVVVVTIAYRLGPLGFLSHPDLDGKVQANFGLHDQLAALQWVQDHIAKFGGNPDRVMMFGESAGAEDVLALLMTPASDGLIHSAALHSTAGFGLAQPTLEDEQRRGKALADALGIQGGDELRQLRQVPFDKLLDTYYELFPDHYHSPAIDGALLTESTWQSIARGAAIDVPIIIGSNADEWRDTVKQDANRQDVEQAASALEYIESDVALASVHNVDDFRHALDLLYTADQMRCPSQHTALAWNAAGGNAWNYFFTRVRDGDAGKAVGAFHGAEYTYVFDTNYAGMPVTATDRALTAVMSNYWINLALNGDPNAETLPAWPRFHGNAPQSQELGDTVTTIARPDKALCQSFDRSFSNRATSQ